MRKDLSYDQYLSEAERQELDAAVEKLALDLDALRKTLRDLKGIKYWTVKTYYVQWCDFDQQREHVLSRIIEVDLEIRKRSIREKQKKNGLGGTPPHLEQRGSHSAQIHGSSRTCAPGDQNEIQRVILNAVADEGINAIRSSIESRIHPHTLLEGCNEPVLQGRILAGGTVHISSSNGLNVIGTASGMKWRVPPKSSSAPPSVTVPECVELQDMVDSVD
ncbi:unnamed protein product [Rhizoctonia solani]|nr:unnamed protein product [Rhizoctonia solani]